MEAKRHWESVYGSKAADAVSWYVPHLTESLSYVQRTGFPKSAAVIDVGGGEATLVDDLLDEGYLNVSVLDISSTALEVCRERLGDRAQLSDHGADATAGQMHHHNHDAMMKP